MDNKKSRVTGWIEKHILPLADKISRQRHLASIQSAFLSTMPMMMIGSFALILAEPPVNYETLSTSSIFYGFFKAWAGFASVASDPLYFLFNVTLGCLSVYVAIGIAYFLSKKYNMDPFIMAITVLATFLLLNSERLEGGYSSSFFDGTGLFAAMIVAILTCELCRFMKEKHFGQIKMPEGVPTALANSFESLVPATIITSFAMIFSWFLKNVMGTTFPALVLHLVQPLIKFIDNVFGVTFISIIQQILWWFGIHDSAIGAIISPIRNSNFAANAAAYAAGTPIADLPYTFTSPYWWVFVTIGGSGATFALAVLLLRSKSKQLKTVGRIGIVPAFFNINEPILFGVPIILNPLFLVPFVTAQTLNAIITYICMASGIVNKTIVEPGWNMFAPIGALIATLDFKAVILITLLIILDGVIYYPFLKVYEKKLLKEESNETESIA